MKLFPIAQLMWDRLCVSAAGAFARFYCARSACYILVRGPASRSFLEKCVCARAGESATFLQGGGRGGGFVDHVPCVFSNSAFASVRIPGGVAHIEIGVEVNKCG